MLVCALQEGLQPGVVVGEYIGETNNTNTDYDEAPPLKVSNVALSNVGSPSCSQDRRKLLNVPGYESLFDGEAWRLQHSGGKNIDAGPSAARRCPGRNFLYMRYANHSRRTPIPCPSSHVPHPLSAHIPRPPHPSSCSNPNMRPVSVTTGDTAPRVFFITVKKVFRGQVSIAYGSLFEKDD